MSPRFDGPDVAHYQGDAFPWQWCVDMHQIRFGGCKMTEGTAFVDSTGSRNRNAMKAAGVRWRGMYHYAQAGDPVANVKHFATEVGPLEPGEFVFLDVESGMTPTIAAVVAMLEAFEQVYPGRVARYQGKYFASGDTDPYAAWPWILPAYPWPNQVLPQTHLPVTVWQWAGGAHGVDVDYGLGPRSVDSNMVLIPEALDRICNLTAAPPDVPVPPEEQHMAYFRDDRTNGWQIWVVSTDAVGNVWTCPITDLPDRGKWDKVQPILGDPPLKSFGSLAALMDAQNRPTPPSAPPPSGLTEHTHLGGVTGPTGGVIR